MVFVIDITAPLVEDRAYEDRNSAHQHAEVFEGTTGEASEDSANVTWSLSLLSFMIGGNFEGHRHLYIATFLTMWYKGVWG